MSLINHPCISRLCRVNNLRLLFYLVHRHTSKSSFRNVQQNDALDDYTENILQENCNKINEFIFKISLKKPIFNKILNGSCKEIELFQQYTEEELVCKIIESIRNCDINNVVLITKVCKEKSYCLPYGFMLYLTKLFAKLGNKEGFELMLSYHKRLYENEFIRNYSFKHYLAQMLWYSGNVTDSLEILEQLYHDSSTSLKYEVNYIIYDLISDVVVKHGEASLVIITDFIQKLADKHNYYPMAILWRQLNESEWFADQQLANKILINNQELINVIKPLIPVWCAHYIKCNKTDVVFRLCEVLLKYNALDQYSSVLHSLFDYHYSRNSLKGCTSIVKSALDLNIPLKESYQKRFLILLTTRKQVKVDSKSSVRIPKRISNQINLKF